MTGDDGGIYIQRAKRNSFGVPRKPNHGFFLQERTRQALHARNDAPGSAGCSAKIAELEQTGDTVLPFSSYWKDITVTRWNIHKREWSAAIEDTLNAGRRTRQLVDRVLA